MNEFGCRYGGQSENQERFFAFDLTRNSDFIVGKNLAHKICPPLH